MKIGIIGAGNIGETVATLFAKAGHQVAVSNSRGPQSLTQLVAGIGHGAQAMTVEEAASFGEIILLAIPWIRPEGLPSPASVAGKIVIDAMNPYSAEGTPMDIGERSSSVETAARLPGARIVKAFNTIYFKHLATQGDPSLPIDQRRVIFVAGDDAEAKGVVSRLIEEIGFAAIDTGSLEDGGRRQQPDQPIYNKDIKTAEALALLG